MARYLRVTLEQKFLIFCKLRSRISFHSHLLRTRSGIISHYLWWCLCMSVIPSSPCQRYPITVNCWLDWSIVSPAHALSNMRPAKHCWISVAFITDKAWHLVIRIAKWLIFTLNALYSTRSLWRWGFYESLISDIQITYIPWINMNDILHYIDAIMSALASQITGLAIVCSAVCSGADQRRH